MSRHDGSSDGDTYATSNGDDDLKQYSRQKIIRMPSTVFVLTVARSVTAATDLLHDSYELPWLPHP